MNTDQMQAFLSVVKCGTISRAAEEMFVTESAVSHRISTLEAELGFELFVRKRGQRKVELTEEAERLIPLAQDWISIWRKAIQISVPAHNELRLATAHSIQTYLLPEVLKIFLHRENAPTVSLAGGDSLQCCEMVRSGASDIAIIGDPPSAVTDLVASLAAREDIVFVSAKDSVYGDEVRIADLDVEKEIFVAWSKLAILWHDRWFGSEKQPLMRMGSVTQQARILNDDPTYWMTLPYSVALGFSAYDLIKISTLDQEPPPRDLWFIHRSGSIPQHLNNLAEDFKVVVSDTDRLVSLG